MTSVMKEGILEEKTSKFDPERQETEQQGNGTECASPSRRTEGQREPGPGSREGGDTTLGKQTGTETLGPSNVY